MSKQAGRLSQGANDFLAPYAPTIGTATDVGTSRPYNNGAATVTFTADARNAADSFTVTSSPGGYTGTGSSSPVTVTGLQSNTSYTFTVTATNTYGTSASSSASNSITATTVPGKPGTPSASSPTGYSPGVNSAGTTTDNISWTAPADGGKSITNYHWESNDSKSGDTGTATSASGISQEGGTSQQYRVYATNANGNSEYSDYSNSVTTFSFTPFSFAPFGFTPFGAFGFTPFGAFGFTPFGAFGFTPGCIDEDTLVTVVGPNNAVIAKAAKDLQIGDEVWTATFDEYVDESDPSYSPLMQTPTLTNTRLVKSNITGIVPLTKTQTLYYNNDISKRFSLEEKMLVKRDNVYSFIPSGNVMIGDFFIVKNEDNTFSEVEVTAIDYIDEDRTVYRFNSEPIDHLIAGNLVVHNLKL
jgi:hypothetical protein